MRRWQKSIIQKERVYPNVERGWMGEILQVVHAIRDGEDLSESRYISLATNEAVSPSGQQLPLLQPR